MAQLKLGMTSWRRLDPCIALLLCIFSLCFYESLAVDRAKFKTCDQATFCKRHRQQESPANYAVVPGSVRYNASALTAELTSHVNELKLTLVSLEDSTLRLLIDEKDGLRKRFQPLDALRDPAHLPVSNFKKVDSDAEFVTLLTESARILLNFKPFRLDIYIKDELVMSVNPNNDLKVEHFRRKEDGNETEAQSGFWDENFSTHHDSKPFGSSSVGVGISFIGYKYIFGIPEHADSFALRSTTGTEPYRLYNLDVFEFETNSRMSLYGAIPFVVAHNSDQTLGMLWLNAAETWIDISSSTADKGILKSIIDKIKSSVDVPQIDTHFISESGVIDMFLMLGPKPNDVFRQNSGLTGRFPLPPLFALGYHQSRWNYNDQDDVREVHENFDKYDIPLDVIWLDIEHTDGKRYFTWDPHKFSKPKEMIENLTVKGRKLVTIADPHIKVDSAYFLYKEAESNGYFVKNKDGSNYEGHCWPGASMYLDFLNPAVRDFWAKKLAFDQYRGSTEDVFTWNDMNEPSVFSGPEVTMHKDARHFGDWEHREIHNIYGLLHHSSTYKGQLARTNGRLRPFVLTRSFFAGSQRTTSVWTGDNTASWEQLKVVAPTLLSLSIAGIPHVGADVGGFFNNPDGELITRWYQAAAFQPFFRSHSHIDTRRREPWMFAEEYLSAMRNAIRWRYKFLPYWYTQFYEHMLTGKPVMRPLWAEFTDDENSFDEDREWMIGPALLVRPIMDPGLDKVSLYLPGKRQSIWFEWKTHKPCVAPGAVYVDVTIEEIPIFQRGGTIIPTWERVRRASPLMRKDPITLYVAANYVGDFANGTMYIDDGETYSYKNGEYAYWGFTFRKESDFLYSISSKSLDPNGKLESEITIEKVVIRNARFFPTKVHVYLDDWNPELLEYTHDRDNQVMVIRNPKALLTQEFRIDIHT